MTNDLRIGIVGSRRRNTHHDRKLVFSLVQDLITTFPERQIVIVSGACSKGADMFAREAAMAYKVPIIEYPVPSRAYPNRFEYRLAAYARNRTIAENSDIGFALVHTDRTGGTENTAGHYIDLGKKIFFIHQNGQLTMTDGKIATLKDIEK